MMPSPARTAMSRPARVGWPRRHSATAQTAHTSRSGTVAMAVYAANGLSRGALMETSWAAVKLGLTGYIIPFMFVFAPSLLLMGDASTVLLATVTATIGVVCLAAGLHEYFFFGPTRWWERLLLIGAALVLIKPGWQTDLVGFVLVSLTIASQLMLRNAATLPSKEPR